MLEMLNPQAGDVVRFVAGAVRTRARLQKVLQGPDDEAARAAAEMFCTTSEQARRIPDLERLEDLCTRHFGWKARRWRAEAQQLRRLLDDARLSTIEHRGRRVQCYRWDACGETRGRMLLCHGWEGCALDFAAFIRGARDRGWAVHAFDHVAHGRSDGTISGLPAMLETLLAVFAHVTKRHGPIDALAGHSLGGSACAWSVANGRIEVPRLALFAPFYDMPRLIGYWCRVQLLPEGTAHAIETGVLATSELKFDALMPPALGKGFSRRKRTETFVVHDSSDTLTPSKHSVQLAALAPNVRAFVTSRLGHVGILGDERCVERCLDFLDRGSIA
jgi:pimeloyl-ACP methyl ester carboxylesterase